MDREPLLIDRMQQRCCKGGASSLWPARLDGISCSKGGDDNERGEEGAGVGDGGAGEGGGERRGCAAFLPPS